MHTGELDDFTRAGLRTMPYGFKRRTDKLEERFKLTMTQAQNLLISEKYTCAMAETQREPGEYVRP
jgi:hypothetical protein